jgi:hypothetical protein
MRSARVRLAGLGMLLLAFGPVLVTIIGLFLVTVVVVNAARATSLRIAAVTAILDDAIAPGLQRIEAGVTRLAAPAAELRAQVDRAMAALSQLGTMEIERGAWGSTSTLHLKLPRRDLYVRSPSPKPRTIGQGALFDEKVGVPIPSDPITMPTESLQRAVAPFAPQGSANTAISGMERTLGKVAGETAGLGPLIAEVGNATRSLLTSLQTIADRVLGIGTMILFAFLMLLIVHAMAAVAAARHRRAEAAALVAKQGPMGFLRGSHHAMLLRGMALVSDRDPVPVRDDLLGLRARAAWLQSEIAGLRAQLLDPARAAAARAPST